MRFRKPLKITSRTSSVTNGFVQAIIPSREPSPDERREALGVLNIRPDDLRCVYCGSPSTDWDHLEPLVRNKRPSGYFNELRNLVPACGRCNQSKSGQPWKQWLQGNATGSPRARGVTDIEDRVATLEAFVQWGALERVDLAELVGPELWNEYWSRLDQIFEAMASAQKMADEIRARIEVRLAESE